MEVRRSQIVSSSLSPCSRYSTGGGPSLERPSIPDLGGGLLGQQHGHRRAEAQCLGEEVAAQVGHAPILPARGPRVRSAASPSLGSSSPSSCGGGSSAAGRRADPGTARAPDLGSGALLVGDTGIERETSSVSGKRATAAPIARPGLATGPSSALVLRGGDEVETGFEPLWTALQACASPLGRSTARGRWPFDQRPRFRADDGIRTR